MENFKETEVTRNIAVFHQWVPKDITDLYFAIKTFI